MGGGSMYYYLRVGLCQHKWSDGRHSGQMESFHPNSFVSETSCLNEASGLRVQIWLPVLSEGTRLRGETLWIIFIHGGAWRDPDIDSSFAHPTVDRLGRSDHFAHIAGVASLNYRLSSRDLPERILSRNESLQNNAVHPDHIDDVFAGIDYLQARFHMGEHYMLVGHSCGATLALQTLFLQRHEGAISKGPYHHQARAIVGIAGLYDLPLLRDMDAAPPLCHNFLTAAFGADETVWEAVSPARKDYRRLWRTGRVVILVTCRADEYVSPQQQSVMLSTLGPWRADGNRSLQQMVVQGRHDEVWVRGDMVQAVEAALDELMRLVDVVDGTPEQD